MDTEAAAITSCRLTSTSHAGHSARAARQTVGAVDRGTGVGGGSPAGASGPRADWAAGSPWTCCSVEGGIRPAWRCSLVRGVVRASASARGGGAQSASAPDLTILHAELKVNVR